MAQTVPDQSLGAFRLKITQPVSEEQYDWTTYPVKKVKWASIFHMVIGGFSIVTQIVLLSILPMYPYVLPIIADLDASYCGLWCGIIFAATGVLGIMTIRQRSTHWNASFVVSHGLSVLFAIIMFAISIDSGIQCRVYCRDNYSYQNWCGSSSSMISLFCSLLSIIAVIEFALASVMLVISGRILCFKCQKPILLMIPYNWPNDSELRDTMQLMTDRTEELPPEINTNTTDRKPEMRNNSHWMPDGTEKLPHEIKTNENSTPNVVVKEPEQKIGTEEIKDSIKKPDKEEYTTATTTSLQMTKEEDTDVHDDYIKIIKEEIESHDQY